MTAVVGLGHVGIYVRDLEKMVAFYRDTLGMRITKQNWRAGIVFFSTDPERADHEIALFRGRAEDADARLINQISLRVGTLDDLLVFHRRLVAEVCASMLWSITSARSVVIISIPKAIVPKCFGSLAAPAGCRSRT